MSVNIGFGYLSILLCYLSVNTTIRKEICVHIQGKTLRHLLTAGEEFLEFHRQVAHEVLEIEQEENVNLEPGFVGRSQAVIDLIREEEGLAK